MSQPDPYQQFPSGDHGDSSAVVRLLIIGAVLIGLMIVGCIGAGVLFARTASTERGRNEAPSIYTLRLANGLPGMPPTVLNGLAWRAATDPDVSREVLEEARRAAAKCVKADRDNAAYLDTLATVFYRLGHHHSAVLFERLSLDAQERPFAVSQLARFEVSTVAEFEGAIVLGTTPLTGSPAVRFGDLDPTTGRRPLVVTLSEVPEDGVTLHFVAEHSGRLLAHFELRIRGDTPLPNGELVVVPQMADGFLATHKDDLAFRLVLVDTTPVTTPRMWLVPMDPEVEALP